MPLHEDSLAPCHHCIAQVPVSGSKGSHFSLHDWQLLLVLGLSLQGQAAPPDTVGSFDGVDDQVIVSNLSAPAGSLTLEAWVHYTGSSFSGFNTILEFGQDAPWFGVNGGRLELYPAVNSGSTTMPLGTWTHVACSWDGTTSRVFINGTVVGTSTTAPTRTGAGMGIGRRTGDVPWKGQIDEVRIWNVARTTNEIAQNVAAALTGTEGGLLAYYRFDEGTGANAADATGHGYKGVFTNGTGWAVVTQPTNNAFANRISVAGLTLSASGSNGSATKEPGEPNHGGNAGGKSVWWTWTAPTNGLASIDTVGSSFDTLLGVYTGNSVAGLTMIAGNDDATNVVITSLVNFNTTAGVAYHIAVDGFRATSGLVTNGTIVLNLRQQPAPANDLFANRSVLTGLADVVSASNAAATREPGEPNHSGNAGGRSLWWTWTAPANGSVTISTVGSTLDTVLGVYTGTSVGGLTLLASNDDGGGSGTSLVTINAVAGGTYQIAVDGYNGASGTIVLRVEQQPGPDNDHFATRLPIVGMASTVSGSNVLATREPGEPYHAGEFGDKSIWWKWIAPTNGPVTIDTLGSGNTLDTLLGVYTGTAVGSLTMVASNNDASGATNASLVSFVAVAGTEYQIAVDGWGGGTGSIVVTVRQTLPTPPLVEISPATTNVVAGANAMFKATASGTPPLDYQWYFENTLLVGQTATNLVLNNVLPNEAGVYRVVVTNAMGAASNSATLFIVQPTLTISPASTNAQFGGSVTFVSTTTAVQPLNYQWYFEGTPLDGQTFSSLTLDNVQANQSGVYQLLATQANLSLSNAATLTVLPATVVTSPDDSGPGTLRNAILYANSHPGPDTVTFDVPGPGPVVMAPSSVFPVITESIVIDGMSQPGYAGTPLIVLDGLNAGSGTLLDVATSNSILRGLCVQRQAGNAIGLRNGGGHTITGCFLGTDASGTTAQVNALRGILIDHSAGNVIGGTTAADRNLIVGGVSGSLTIQGAGSSNNVVLGNYLGLDAGGTHLLARSSVFIVGAHGNTIGGTAVGARNVIIGDANGGVRLASGSTGNRIQGNYIGVNAGGGALFLASPDTTAVGVIVGSSSNAIIGNVISGNGAVGISLFGGARNVIQGNLIGTDAAGVNAVPNGFGIRNGDSGSAASSLLIGGNVPAARNVISGNRSAEIFLDAWDFGTTVQGNYVGTDLSGTALLLTGKSAAYGILSQGSGTLIGGAGPGEGNVLAGNTNAIVAQIASNDRIVGNLVGVGADGTTLLARGQRGIELEQGLGAIVASNTISGQAVSGLRVSSSQTLIQANIISRNAGKGIVLMGNNNALERNSIYSNDGLALDRFDDGPTPATTNGGVIAISSAKVGSVIIEGQLTGLRNLPYEIEFALNTLNETPPQAEVPLGTITIIPLGPVPGDTNNMFGIGPFSITFPYPAKPGDTVVARPVDPNGNSGEFTPPIGVGGGIGPGTPSGSSAANTPNHGVAGEPISTFTGELYDQLGPDLDLGGPMPLRFTRYYASMLKRDNFITGRLGDNWLHNFEWTLSVTATNTVRIVNSMGRLIEFTNNSGVFQLTGLQETPFQLTSSGGEFILGDPRSQRLFTFDATGKLTRIADGHGNAHTLAYTGSLLSAVSDGLGRTFSFSYNASGALTNVTDGARHVAFTQTGGNLTSARTPLGFTTTYAFDLANANPGLLTATTRPAGNVPWAQVFDSEGRVVSQTDGGKHTATLSYAGTVTTFTNPRGDVQRDTHTADGDRVSFEDESGRKIVVGYNGSHQRNLVTDRLGDTIGITYHAPSGRPAAVTNADGTVNAFTYATRTNHGLILHDMAQATFPDGTTEQFAYDANGNVITRTDRAGKVWTFTYNARGQVLTAVNPAGGTTIYTYDAAGNLASRRDSDTGPTTYAYDPFSRLTKLTHPDGAMLQLTYDADDRLTSTIDERGNTTSFDYDDNGNLVRVTDAMGHSSGFAHDARDRVIRSTNRLGQVSSRAFGPLDQLIAVTNRNGQVTTFGYDARRRLVSTTDPGGKTWSMGYDEEDIPIAVSNPLGQTTATGTDNLGYPVTSTNALGHVTRVVRDAMSRVTATVDGIGRTNDFGYDARGLLASATKPVIGTATYLRSDLGQLARITDLNGSQWDFSHTPMGREAGRADPLGRVQTMTYDARGRPLRMAFPDGVTCTNFYDPAGNLVRRAYSDGTDYQFAYDALNRIVSANGLAFAYDAEGRLTHTTSSGADYAATYDAGGRLSGVSYHNGAFIVNYTYDSRDRLVRVSDTLTGTQLDFAYDDAGRMISLTRPNGVNGAYAYDAAGRLTRIQEGSIVDLQFTFDAARQITAVNHTAPLDPASLIMPTAQVHSYDAAHQIRTPGYAYDARGRQTAAPGHSFQWDGASRLRQIDSVTLTYDGADNLQTRTAGGVTVRYFYHHAIGLAPIMAERNETAGRMQRYYVWTPGGRLLYAIDPANGNAVSHYHFDQVGSTLALTAANGTVIDAYAYTPYGVLLGHTGTSTQPFTYVGAYGVRAEPAANLSHMRARYYEPANVRFITKDPVGPRLLDPMTVNVYEYSEHNPLFFTDPRGTESSGIISIFEPDGRVVRNADGTQYHIPNPDFRVSPNRPGGPRIELGIHSDGIGSGGNNRFSDLESPALATVGALLALDMETGSAKASGLLPQIAASGGRSFARSFGHNYPEYDIQNAAFLCRLIIYIEDEKKYNAASDASPTTHYVLPSPRADDSIAALFFPPAGVDTPPASSLVGSDGRSLNWSQLSPNARAAWKKFVGVFDRAVGRLATYRR